MDLSARSSSMAAGSAGRVAHSCKSASASCASARSLRKSWRIKRQVACNSPFARNEFAVCGNSSAALFECRDSNSRNGGYTPNAYACRAMTGRVGVTCPDSLNATNRPTRLPCAGMIGNGADPSAARPTGGLKSANVSRPSMSSSFCAITTRPAAASSVARLSSCHAFKSPEAPGSGGR